MAKAAEQANEQVEEGQEASGVEVNEAQLPEAADGGATISSGQIDVLLDMTMPVSACLGQVEMEIRQLLRLGPGSVLQLDKKAGEPVDLYLHGAHFATGNLVVVGDQLGVRIREIMPSGSAGQAASQAPAAETAKAAT